MGPLQEVLQVPDLITARIGFRSWSFDTIADIRMLRSHCGVPWVPEQPLAAVCRAGYVTLERDDPRFLEHPAPVMDCTCGIYARNDEQRIATANSRVVVGTVWLWGKTVVHEFGWRAEYAYPRSFFDVGTSPYREAGALFRVPIEDINIIYKIRAGQLI